MANTFDLTGKTALVTGGNGGIGLGIARSLAGAGANVVVAARNRDKTDAAVDELKGIGVVSVVQAIAEEFGGIDVLVNNAGIGIRKPPQDYSLEEWQRSVTRH